MDAEKLKQILVRHKAWLACEPGGVRADLRSADLSGADLSGADLRGAELRSADLHSADLSGADLSSANLRSADLRSADFSSADLRSANLHSADLSGADLSSANLRSADLRSADFSSADLRGADLRSADLSALGGLSVEWYSPDPALPRLVADAALKDGALNMSCWHACETTHCLAGWAIHLSGDLGRALEALTSPSVAGSILLPSASHLFFGGKDEALAWCREQLPPAEVTP